MFLVLDEPTAALDTATQARLMTALAELEHTMSVVLITHRQELLELAERVVRIEDGRIAVGAGDARECAAVRRSGSRALTGRAPTFPAADQPVKR